MIITHNKTVIPTVYSLLTLFFNLYFVPTLVENLKFFYYTSLLTFWK